MSGLPFELCFNEVGLARKIYVGALTEAVAGTGGARIGQAPRILVRMLKERFRKCPWEKLLRCLPVFPAVGLALLSHLHRIVRREHTSYSARAPALLLVIPRSRKVRRPQ